MNALYLKATTMLLILNVAPVALATSFGCSISYFTRIHFGQYLNDKEIAGVYAHLGSFQQRATSRGGGTYWADVKHLPLELKDDQFEIKTIINGKSSYEDTYNKGAKVQYWIYFTDGSELITDAYSIDVSSREMATEEWSEDEGRMIPAIEVFERKRKEQEILLKESEVNKTEAVRLEYCWTS